MQPVRLNSDLLFSTQLANFDLLSVAFPILEDIQQNAPNTSSAVIFANHAGCVLEISGDDDIIEKLNADGILKGCFLSEEIVGTNSIGLALMERMPVQVVGAEHYHKTLHTYGSAAAPLFDLTGHSLGVVSIFTYKENYHPYILGLVTVAAKAIEGQRQAEVLLGELNNQLDELNAVLSTISEAILVLGEDQILMHANKKTSQLLGFPVETLVGKPINAYLSIEPSIQENIDMRTPARDKEVAITVEDRLINAVLDVRYVYKNNQIRWILVILRPVHEVRQLVQNQVGANAVLTLDDIPGHSTSIQQVRRLVRSAAPARASILIQGEPGTGKNVLASAIHNFSPHHDGPFVIFACGSIPNELILTELLGYEESFIVNHVGSRPSKFELAEGGTLYFQDVDTLPPEAQVVLLNVLDLGVVQRLGSTRPRKVDCRVIASTTADIKKLVAQKIFRSDLYYRLSMFSIPLPPLRERPQDIPEVVERILNRYSNQTDFKVTLDDGVMEILRKYYWPGNIREIETVLGRIVMQANADSVIRAENLPPNTRLPKPIFPLEDSEMQLGSFDEMEKRAILRAAQLCQGNITRMSEILGISRTTLWRRLKVLDIDLDNYRHLTRQTSLT